MTRPRGSVAPSLPDVSLHWGFFFWDTRSDKDTFLESRGVRSGFETDETKHDFEVKVASGGADLASGTCRYQTPTSIGALLDQARGRNVTLHLVPPDPIRGDRPAAPDLTYNGARWNSVFHVRLRPVSFELTIDDNGFVEPPADQAMIPGTNAVSPDQGRANQAPHGYLQIHTTKKDGVVKKQLLEVDWKFDVVNKHGRIDNTFERKKGDFFYDIWTLVIHITTGPKMSSALRQLLNRKSGAHYVVDIDGHVVKLLDEEWGTKHAGWNFDSGFRSGWRQLDFGRKTNHNLGSIGVEHAAASGVPWPAGQIDGSANLVRAIVDTFQIAPCDVVRHRDLAVHNSTWATGHRTSANSERSKDCPGNALPWRRYQDDGLTLAPLAVPVDPTAIYHGIFAQLTFIDDETDDPATKALQVEAITELQKDLRRIGYWCPLWKPGTRRRLDIETRGVLDFGSYDEATQYAVQLSQQRFMTLRGITPATMGRADAATATVIKQVVANNTVVLPPLHLPTP